MATAKSGTLAAFGLAGAALGTALTLTLTTLTATTVNAGVGNFTTSLSGATLKVGTGIVLRDTDGEGCSAIHIKNGVLSAQTHAC